MGNLAFTRLVTFVLVSAVSVNGVGNSTMQEWTPSVEESGGVPIGNGRSLETCSLLPMENIESAWQWAKPTGMIVYQNGQILFEEYDETRLCFFFCQFSFIRTLLFDWLRLPRQGGTPTQTFELYSVTKNLAGLTAVLLKKQGWIESLDEKVSNFIPEWANEDGLQRTATIHDLLSLSSGIHSRVFTLGMSLRKALSTGLRADGELFSYGWQPFLIFSKLAETALFSSMDVQTYLGIELFSKLGISIEMNSVDGLTQLNSGGRATVRTMATLGLELLDAANGNGQVFTLEDIQELLSPGVNANYGLAFWLNEKGMDSEYEVLPPSYAACGAREVFHFKGALDQIVTVVPKQQLVIVKSSAMSPPIKTRFWDLLFQDQQCECVAP